MNKLNSIMNYLLLLSAVLLLSSECFCSPLPNATEIEKSQQTGGFIVIAGGNDINHNERQTVYLMNTYTRKWSSMADLPKATIGSWLFYADGKLLIAGGSSTTASFLMYDSTGPTWKALPDLSKPVGDGPCGTILAGSLYLVGGKAHSSGSLVMNPFNFPSWVEGATLKQGRRQCGAATLGNNIYVCGHRSTGADGKTCEKYDPASNSWSFIASMNECRLGKILVALNGFLYAVGGNNLGTAERYDPETDAWTYIQPVLDKARSNSVAVTDGKLIYLTGGCDEVLGCDPGLETNNMEVYMPEVDYWVMLTPMPEARENPAIAYLPQLPWCDLKRFNESSCKL